MIVLSFICMTFSYYLLPPYQTVQQLPCSRLFPMRALTGLNHNENITNVNQNETKRIFKQCVCVCV